MSASDYEFRARLFCKNAEQDPDKDVGHEGVAIPLWQLVAERMEEHDLFAQYILRGEVMSEQMLEGKL